MFELRVCYSFSFLIMFSIFYLTGQNLSRPPSLMRTTSLRGEVSLAHLLLPPGSFLNDSHVGVCDDVCVCGTCSAVRRCVIAARGHVSQVAGRFEDFTCQRNPKAEDCIIDGKDKQLQSHEIRRGRKRLARFLEAPPSIHFYESLSVCFHHDQLICRFTKSKFTAIWFALDQQNDTLISWLKIKRLDYCTRGRTEAIWLQWNNFQILFFVRHD